MGEVWIKHESEIPWPEWGTSDKGRQARLRYVSDQTKGPTFFFSEYAPNVVVNAHSHEVNECIYVLEGFLKVGKTPCYPGTLVFVEKHTVYGPLAAGPTGVKFLNIRGGHSEGAEFRGKDVYKTSKPAE